MNGRTTFSDAWTTALAATVAISVIFGNPDDGYGAWLARFVLSLAASYLFWHRYHQRRRLDRDATETDAG